MGMSDLQGGRAAARAVAPWASGRRAGPEFRDARVYPRISRIRVVSCDLFVAGASRSSKGDPSMLIERYRRWFDYERDCNEKVLRTLGEVPESKHATEAFGRATMLFAHTLAARQMWLFRLGAAPEKPREFFPENVSVPDLARRSEAIEAAWASYLDGL